MYQISDFLLFKGSIIIDFRERGRILNEFKETTNQQARKMSLVEDEAADQRNVSSDSVHTARYNSSLRDCRLLAMDLWTNPHSSARMKEMYPDMAMMASMARIPVSKGFSWEEMANEQEQLKMLLTRFVEMLTPKGAKPQEASEAEKPNEASEAEKSKEASSQKQNLISNERNLAMLATHVVEKLI